MHTSSRPVSAALAAALAAILALTPAPASAQLGGFIKKRAADAVADKVLGQQGNSREPKFSSTVLEINGERLDQLLRGVDAEVAAYESVMRPFRAYEDAVAARNAALAEQGRCQEQATAEYNRMATGIASRVAPGAAAGPTPEMQRFYEKMAALPEAERDALMKRAEKFADQMSAANDRGDTPTAMRIAAEAKADMERTVGAPMPTPTASGGGARISEAESNRMEAVSKKMEQDVARCAAMRIPPEPERPEGYGQSIDGMRDTVRAAALTASGLTAAQYAVMRERAAVWIAIQGGKPAEQYKFTSGEEDALKARMSDLRAREKALLAEYQSASWRL